MLKEFSMSAHRMPSRAGKIAIMKRMRRETAREAGMNREGMGDWDGDGREAETFRARCGIRFGVRR